MPVFPSSRVFKSKVLFKFWLIDYYKDVGDR